MFKKKNFIRGFTLLEILLATAIFGIILTAIYSAYISGTRVYESGTQIKEVYSAIRIAQERILRDLRSTVAIEETAYQIPPIIEETPYEYYGEEETEVDETIYSTNPYPFIGTETEVRFYTYLETPVLWTNILVQSICQVNYFYDGKDLKYSISGASDNLEQSSEGIITLIPNVAKFQIFYGYRKRGEWHWVTEWHSAKDMYRRPRTTEEKETKKGIPILVYPDNLPEAIKMVFSVKDEQGNGRHEPIQRTFYIITDIPAAKSS